MSNTTDLQKCMWFRPYYVQKVRFLPFFFFTAMSDWSADRVLFIKAPVACPWVGSNHQPFQRHVKHSWTRKMPVIQDVFWAKVRVLERFFSWQWVTCLWIGFSLQKHPSLGGLEPPTFRLTAERANRLRHRDNMPKLCALCRFLSQCVAIIVGEPSLKQTCAAPWNFLASERPENCWILRTRFWARSVLGSKSSLV